MDGLGGEAQSHSSAVFFDNATPMWTPGTNSHAPRCPISRFPLGLYFKKGSTCRIQPRHSPFDMSCELSTRVPRSKAHSNAQHIPHFPFPTTPSSAWSTPWVWTWREREREGIPLHITKHAKEERVKTVLPTSCLVCRTIIIIKGVSLPISKPAPPPSCYTRREQTTTPSDHHTSTAHPTDHLLSSPRRPGSRRPRCGGDG